VLSVVREYEGRFCLPTRVTAFALIAAFVLSAQQSPLSERAEIQRILKTNCQPCHNDTTRSSGLSLTSRDGIVAGGNRGPAIKPGSPDESLLVRAIEQSGDLKMPPGRTLAPDEVSSIRHWIESGAAWPGDDEIASSSPW
jgi:mono/diheme cytochrome c family protein